MRDHRRQSANRCLLHAAILAGLAGFLMQPEAAYAQCLPTTSPTTGQTVNCSGTSTTPVVAGAGQTGITVNVLDGAQLNTNPAAIRLLDGSFINFFGTGSIGTTGIDAFGAGIFGNSGTITLNGSSHIGTTGNASVFGAAGTAIIGNSAAITLNDNSSISTAGGSAVGAGIGGDFGATTLNDNSSISTTGGAATGAFMQSNSGTITLNGSSSVSTTGLNARGVYIDGNSSTITLNDSSSVSTTGLGAYTVFFDNGSNMLINHGTLSSTQATTVLGANGFTDTVFNYGTISSGAGTAISLGSGNDLLTLGTGSHITGTIDGGSNTDAVTLTGTGAAANTFLNWESLTMNGQDWSLSGPSSFGTIDVLAGTLNVASVLTSTLTTVHAGATLMTSGGSLVGDVTNQGIFSPGGAGVLETTSITGNFLQTGSGAIYEVGVDAAGNGDKAIVNGAVNLTGSVLHVLAANGNYSPSTSYLIIDKTSAGPVIGTFASVTANLAFLTPSVVYNGGNGNDVVLNLERNATLFQDVANTKNQRAVAGALDQFPTNNALFLAVVNQTAEGARQAFDALSGEIHATVPGVLADDSRYVREAVLGRLMQASYTNGSGQVASLGANGPQVASLDTQAMTLGYDDKSLAAPPSYAPGLAFWTRGFGAWGDFNGNSNAASVDRNLGGFVSGLDANIGGSWRLGLGAGYSQSDINVDARHSGADVESFHLAGYGGGMAGSFALRGGGAWTWNNIDTSRAVIFPGFFEREKASYDADTGQLFGEVAYPIAMGRTALEPFAGLAFVSIDTDSFKENGALAGLRSRGVDENVGYSTLGLRAASTMNWGSAVVTPHVSAAWQHAFDDITPDAALLFASTGIGFTITGVPLAEDTALVEAGLDLSLSPTATLGASYSGQFGDGVEDNAVKGRFTWLF